MSKTKVASYNHMAMCFDVTQPRASDQKNSRPFIRCSSLHTGHEKKVSPKMPESHGQIAVVRQRWWGGKTCDVIDPELVRSEFVRPVPTQPLTVLRHLWAVPQLDVGFVAQLSS